MKTKNIFPIMAMVCAVVALVGCASPERGVSGASSEPPNRQPTEAPASPTLPQHAVLDESAFRKLDLNADGVITLDEWLQFDTSARAKENFSALDENGDGRINVTEFLRQAPKYSERYHFFGDTDKTDDKYFPADNEVFQQPAWHLFSFHF